MSDEDIRGFTVLQDFYSKRAVAHASFFVASIFGLFTVLSFIERVLPSVVTVNQIFLLPLKSVGYLLLYIIYWLIWLFGLYSLYNFGLYSTKSQHAEVKLAEKQDALIRGEIKNDTKFPKNYLAFKDQDQEHKSLSWLKRNNLAIFVLFYLLFGLLPFIALFALRIVF